MSTLLHQKLLPLVEELRQCVQAADQPALGDTMRPLLENLQRFGRTRSATAPAIWVWVYGKASPEERAHVEAYLENSDEHLWQYGNSTWKTLPPHEVTLHWQQEWMKTNFDDLQRQNSLLGIFFICEDALPDAQVVLSHIALAATQLPVAIVVSALDGQVQEDAFRSLTTGFLRMESWENVASANLKKDVSNLLDARSLDLTVAWSAGMELERVSSIFQQAMQQCDFDLKIKRQQIQQESALAQKNLGFAAGSANSPFTEFKNKFQQRVEQFEKRQAEQFEEQLATGRGRLALALENTIEQLGELEERKTAKNIVFSIPEDFRQRMLDGFLAEARRYCNESVTTNNVFAQSLEETAHRFLEERNLHLSMPELALNSERIEQILRQAVRFERNFEGTALKKKPMEMMMGARMYFMLLMMGASMFGLSQVLRGNMEFYIPLVILLLGLGGWQFLALKQKEQQENKEKYHAAAKEYLKSESRRILQEFSRLWERANGGAIKDWSAMLLREVESILQSAEQGSRSQKEAENNRLKSILNTLQNQERNIESAMRSKAMFERNLSRAKSELSASLKTQLLKFHLPATMTTQ